MPPRHGYVSPLRYPGGKGSLANFIKRTLTENQLNDGTYIELYAGGAGIAWALLFEEYVRRVIINDLDESVWAFWTAVLERTDAICQRILETPVTMDQWHQQRAIQENRGNHDVLELGFSTFFLNRTNRSGILTGGVIGGKGQTGEWKLDARYNKPDLVARIRRIASYKCRVTVSRVDAAECLRGNLTGLGRNVFAYLDPPYYAKGQELYRNHYGPADHQEIAQLVGRLRKPWLVSYDAAPEVLGLYQRFQRLEYTLNYSAQDRYAGTEVIFGSPRLRLPDVESPVGLPIPKLAL